MAKQQKSISYDSAFPTRLRRLLEEHEITHADLAKIAGVQRQAVSKWCSGETVPDIVSLENISRVFSISADWLLGLSDIKAPNMDIQAIGSTTGLSEKSIEILQEYNEGPYGENFLSILNLLIEQEEIPPIAYGFSFCAPDELSAEEAKQLEEEMEERFFNEQAEWEEKNLVPVIGKIDDLLKLEPTDDSYIITNLGNIKKSNKDSWKELPLRKVPGQAIIQNVLMNDIQDAIKRLKTKLVREGETDGKHTES